MNTSREFQLILNTYDLTDLVTINHKLMFFMLLMKASDVVRHNRIRHALDFCGLREQRNSFIYEFPMILKQHSVVENDE